MFVSPGTPLYDFYLTYSLGFFCGGSIFSFAVTFKKNEIRCNVALKTK